MWYIPTANANATNQQTMAVDEPLEQERRPGLSQSVGMRPSPPRISPINNSSKNKMPTGSRLRAATSFASYHPPSSMAVRRTGVSSHHDGGNKSLAAIAGPMGITIVDTNAPQRPHCTSSNPIHSVGLHVVD